MEKVVRLYGPWAKVEETDGKRAALHLARCFNVRFDGNDLVTRDGRTPLGVTPTSYSPSGMFSWNGALYFGLGAKLYRALRGTVTGSEIADGGSAFLSGARWFGVGWQSMLVYGFDGGGLYYQSDAASGQLLPVPGLDALYTSYLTTLPAFVSVAVFQNRLYGLTAGGTVVFSEADNATTLIPFDGSAPAGGANLWPAENNFDAKTGAEDEGKALVPFGGVLAVLTARGLFAWDGSSLTQVGGVGNGCVAKRSAASLPLGVAYLGSDGVRLFAAGTSIKIETGYEETLAHYTNRALWSQAVAVHVPAKSQYRLWLPARGETANTLCLAWDYAANRWMLWGGSPPWLPASAQYASFGTVDAVVVETEPTGPMLLTRNSAGEVWIEDEGITDDGRPIYSCVAWQRLGMGEDEGVKTWKEVRVEAKTTGAALKLAMLADGEEFFEGPGASLYGTATHCATAALPQQTTFTATFPVTRRPGETQGPVEVWGQWKIPHQRVARTVQPVVWCDGADAAGNPAPARMRVRGLELTVSAQEGRR